MAVSISYDEVRTSTPPSQFDLAYTVTATTDIPEEIFLYNAVDPTKFERVALVGDFGFPTAADPLNFPFYRQATVALVFTEFSAAALAKASMRADIATLQAEYQVGMDGWDGTDNIVVT